MKWQGSHGISNVEDRRGKSSGTDVAEVDIVTLVIVLFVCPPWGDPARIIEKGEVATDTPGLIKATEDENAMAQFVSVVLADRDEVWGSISSEAGATCRQPTLVLYSDQAKSGCGDTTTACVPLYCAAIEKVCIGLSVCDDPGIEYPAYRDFAVASVIAYQIGHFDQNLMFMPEEVVSAERSRLSVVRSSQLRVSPEPQKDFLVVLSAHNGNEMFNSLEAGVMEEALNSASSIRDDFLKGKYPGRVIPDSSTRRTAAQRSHWLGRGWETGNLSNGDTFSADI